MAVMAVVSVASFSAKHWIWLSNPLNVFVRVSMICCVAVWMQVVILSCSVLRPHSRLVATCSICCFCVLICWVTLVVIFCAVSVLAVMTAVL